MNPSAIYSKSGKGVQEASGKTSLLKRAERAVLSAIDGRATLAEVAKKVGRPFDGAFEVLISQLDRDGFVREVSGGPAGAPAARQAAPRPAAKAPAAGHPEQSAPDLDFTGIFTAPLATPKPAAPRPASSKPPVDAAASRAREQEAALYKARQEAEARAQEERDRARAEAEAKVRAETEAKLRADAERKLREEAEARAKAKAEAEARAKIEAERRIREEAERKAREEAERARREAEELRQRLEEERRAREEAERKAREEAERLAREEAERKAREEAERKAREEAERKAREEARAREEAERRAREEAERKARAEQEAQMRRAREEAERRREQADRDKEAKERERHEGQARKAEETPLPVLLPEAEAATGGGSGGLDALMADLASFSDRDDDDRKVREAAEERAREERKRKLREESEQRELERAEHERKQEEDRRRREEEQRRAREDEERRAREDEERARQEAEERSRRAREALAAREAQAGSDDIGVTDDDLGMDDVRRDQAAVAKESRRAQREREREAKRRAKEARERDREARERDRAAAKAQAGAPVAASRPRRRRKMGRPVAIALLVLLLAGIGALHLVPLPTEDYQRAASEALRVPVRIGSARLSLFTGAFLRFGDIRIGDGARIASARAYPEIGSLLGGPRAFSRIELEGVRIAQNSLGEALFARTKGPDFSVGRILVKDLKLDGPVPLPLLEADVRLGSDGAVRTVLLRGPAELLGQLTPKDGSVDFDVTAATFALPFAPDLSLGSFAMKGRATLHGMKIDAWGGAALGGAISGTANVRWAGAWQLDGTLKARGINAAAFAPALLSEGTAEGSGKFSMSGNDPAKLARAGRMEGSFAMGKGVLGSFDLSRAIRTDGREVAGRTQFVEMSGQAAYDRGAVALRNVTIGAGALQAGASADIAQSGVLSGRIVADVKTASQSLRTILHLGGTLKDPQVRN